jgi:hypothetical protein
MWALFKVNVRNYATSRMIEGSKLDDVNAFLCNLPNPYSSIGPGVYSASNGNEHQKQKKNNVSLE